MCAMASVIVNVENFVRAETDRMFADLQRDAGGVNRLNHTREPVPVEHQTVTRMNRDTLYSFAIVDIARGATLTVPESGDRYLSVMVVNRDHYINRVFHDAVTYELTVDEFDTPYVCVAVRILMDPADSADLKAVAALQDGFGLTAASAEPFEMRDYDSASFDETRNAVLTLAKRASSFERFFGSKDEVDPIRHLLGTAAGWAGSPTRRRGTAASSPDYRSASTTSPYGTCRWTDSGRCRCTTPTGSSSQRPRCLQHQQPDRRAERRRVGDDQPRRLRGRPAELPADHRGMELPRPPIPTPAGDPGRHLGLPGGVAARLARCSGRSPGHRRGTSSGYDRLPWVSTRARRWPRRPGSTRTTSTG